MPFIFRHLAAMPDVLGISATVGPMSEGRDHRPP
jgi:hypothetical protein